MPMDPSVKFQQMHHSELLNTKLIKLWTFIKQVELMILIALIPAIEHSTETGMWQQTTNMITQHFGVG